MKVPFYCWLDLQAAIQVQRTWQPVAPDVSGFLLGEVATPWQVPVSVAIFRKKVHHRSPKNYQLDLFDPNDGHDEYSAVTSNLAFSLPSLWHFMGGRGGHDTTIGELKHGLAFGSVPTASYAANSAWQQLVALPHNLLVNFQLATGAAAQPARCGEVAEGVRMQAVSVWQASLVAEPVKNLHQVPALQGQAATVHEHKHLCLWRWVTRQPRLERPCRRGADERNSILPALPGPHEKAAVAWAPVLDQEPQHLAGA